MACMQPVSRSDMSPLGSSIDKEDTIVSSVIVGYSDALLFLFSAPAARVYPIPSALRISFSVLNCSRAWQGGALLQSSMTEREVLDLDLE